MLVSLDLLVRLNACPEQRDVLTAILEAVTRAPDPAASLRVTTWILEEMADTFLMLAFANACDECDDAGTPHPDKPAPGGNFADFPEPSDAVREDARAAAVRLYARILAAPGGYDPAPALVRWEDAGDAVSGYWRRDYPRSRASYEATARCWGHYAVMSAIGHGVCWEDDNEPLTGEDGAEMARPGYPLRVYAEDIVWSDRYTEGVEDRAALERAEFIDADRALDERNEAAREAYERKARERGE